MRQNSSTRIFLSPPHIGDRELSFVNDAFASNYIAPLGPMVDAFEREFAEYTGIPHCLAVSSGTAAMHLAIRHLLTSAERGTRSAEGRRGKAERRPLVIASTLTFIGSVTPAVFENCDITFIDCDRDTWNMDPALLEAEMKACDRKGRLPVAVIPTDLYGQCCDLTQIRAICDRYDVPVICDSAEAVGGKYRGRDEGGNLSAKGGSASGGKPEESRERGQGTDHGLRTTDNRQQTTDYRPRTTGKRNVERRTSNIERRTLNTEHLLWRHAGFDARAAVYSFNGNKIITTSGGGMLASHDKALIDHARKLATQARDPAPHYEHSEIGYNYRMSNILGAIGRGQLKVLNKRVERKRRIFDEYRKNLEDLPGLSFMPEGSYCRGNRWLTVVLVNRRQFRCSPERIRQELEAENIESRPMWKPMHIQPVFKGYRCRGGEVAEDLFKRGLCLPSGTALRQADIERVCGIVRRCRVS